jgi:hypothetical protein
MTHAGAIQGIRARFDGGAYFRIPVRAVIMPE